MTSSRRTKTRSMTSTHRNSSLPIPDDLAMEIFSRLPSKAIGRFRCACKPLSSMLRSQDFTDLFLTKSSARPQFLFVCQDRYSNIFGKKYHYSNNIFFSSSSSPTHPHQKEENSLSYVVAANHLARFRSSYELFGCTNGFLCYGLAYGAKHWKGMLYNPITRQSLTLPRLKLSSKRFSRVVESYLGYDPVSKEFKVLSMEGSGISTNHQVLTLGANNKLSSWRSVQCSTQHRSSCKWISIGGVLYYAASANTSSATCMVACFELSVEKFSFVNLGRAMHGSTVMVDYNGKLGLLMSGDARGENISRASKSFELWVLQDDAEWSKHVYVLPPSWKNVVTENMGIVGMIVGTNEIVLSPWIQNVLSYLIYFNVEKNTITKVGIRGLEASHGKRFYTYLNYVENVKLL